ncbi:hypothetical protein CEXT_578741 [Caerostris extrusa]|uniref:Uncharacterized protein n=1 Tax=Caerostris extrusa TaxID=172846 RepID=A0AAV4MJA4_CAEEX|nr:hypothetical protein CEXT_578741 [Caerostris extrusa]
MNIPRNSILLVKGIFFKFFQSLWKPIDVITRRLRRNVEVLRGLKMSFHNSQDPNNFGFLLHSFASILFKNF